MILPDRRLEQLTLALATARRGDDVKAVHQLRVASRRLDAWLRIGGHRVLRDDLAGLRASCGRVRNLDVLLERESSPRPFREWLVTEGAGARAALQAALVDPRVDATVEALARMPGIPDVVARKNVRRALAKVAERGAEVASQLDDLEALHALRRAIRGLRFALEWLDERAPFLVELQDAFGELNDTAVLVGLLHQFLDADPAFVRATDADLARARKAAVKAWNNAEPDLMKMAGTWNSL